MTKNPQDKDADQSKLDLSMLVPPTKVDIERWKQEDEQYNQELRTRAKTPEQLTEGLECTVLEVNGYQGLTFASGEWREGPMRSFSSGHTYRTEIKVESGTLVEKLKFKGWPHLEAGDTIKAYILKGEKQAEKQFGPIDRTPKAHLVERPYKAIENPFKIEKLRDGKVVATYNNS